MNGDRKIKVAFVLGTDLRTGAGVEKVVKSLVLNCDTSIFDIIILNTPYMPFHLMGDQDFLQLTKLAKVITIKNWMMPKFSFISRSELIQSVFNLLLWPAVAKLTLFSNKPSLDHLKDVDVIYLTFNWLCYAVPRSRAIVLGSSHTDFGWQSGDKRSEIKVKLIASGLLFRRIDGFHIFPNASSIANQLGERSNLILPPCGIDCDLFYPRKLDDSKVKVLFVARLVECKGVEFALAFWEDFKRRQDLELHIVGNGPLFNFVKENSKGNIIFHGSIPEEELAAIYGTSDIFIAPTSCDTYSVVAMESLSSGCYTILSDNLIGVFDEFKAINHLEYLPLRAVDWKRRIEIAVRQTDEIRSRRNAVHEYVKENFDHRYISFKFYRYLQSLVGNERAHSDSKSGICD